MNALLAHLDDLHLCGTPIADRRDRTTSGVVRGVSSPERAISMASSVMDTQISQL